jgi:hypothetical protein
MTELIEQPRPDAPAGTDLTTAVHQVLAASSEPLTPPKVKAQLPAPHRSLSLEELTEALNRQAAAGALHQYPKYRSQHDRYWDRSMPVHVANLIHVALEEGPLVWSELRRKLPVYAQPLAETVLQGQVAQGQLFRHPKAVSRGGERYGVRPPEAKDYLHTELSGVFNRLEQMGFSRAQLRNAALQMLHDEEWSPSPPPEPARAQPETGSGDPAERVAEPAASPPEAAVNPPPAEMPSQSQSEAASPAAMNP